MGTLESKFIRRAGIFSRLRTGGLLVLSFAGVLVIGTILLSLPVSAAEARVPFIDALFTATSAVCVTGLITVDTGTAWSPFGQAVIMVLFQIGGLGIMTFSVLMFMSIGRLPSLRDSWVVEKMFSANPRFSIRKLVKYIFAFTMLMEAGGMFLLFFGWLGKGYPPGKALWHSLFHSISAFCNAGFAFYDDSLIGFAGSGLILATFAVLIITGGIGFFVVMDVSEKLRRNRHELSLHTRLVLITTMILLVGGAAMLLFGEWNSPAAGANLQEKIMSALFQSATARTAGFNSMDIAGLSNISLLVLIVLMFIGSSPGSCGGGVRTTSFALLWALVMNRLRGNNEVNISGRTIPAQTMHRVVSIIVIGVLLVTISTMLLMLTQPQEYMHPHDRALFLKYMFESVSALGTVGLSMGITAGLNLQGKLIIIVMMFVGRVGLVTLAYSVLRPKRRVQLRYSTEDVML